MIIRPDEAILEFLTLRRASDVEVSVANSYGSEEHALWWSTSAEYRDSVARVHRAFDRRDAALLDKIILEETSHPNEFCEGICKALELDLLSSPLNPSVDAALKVLTGAARPKFRLRAALSILRGAIS